MCKQSHPLTPTYRVHAATGRWLVCPRIGGELLRMLLIIYIYINMCAYVHQNNREICSLTGSGLAHGNPRFNGPSLRSRRSSERSSR